MAKNNLSNLDRDMIQCEKDGYGCHYGRWKATQEQKPTIKKPIPENALICKHCGKPFIPNKIRTQKFCDMECQREAYKLKHNKYMVEWRKRKLETGCNDG